MALAQTRLGWVLAGAGEPARAEAEYQPALALYRKLVGDRPIGPEYHDQAADLDDNRSVALRRLGRAAEARDHAERAVAAREALIMGAPQARAYHSGLAENLLARGLARRATGDLPGAAADLRRAAAAYDALAARVDHEWYASGCILAALSGMAGAPGAGVSAAEAAAGAQTAMDQLHRAVAMGYPWVDAFRTEDALDPLRDRADFRGMLMDLPFPTDPFVPGR